MNPSEMEDTHDTEQYGEYSKHIQEGIAGCYAFRDFLRELDSSETVAYVDLCKSIRDTFYFLVDVENSVFISPKYMFDIKGVEGSHFSMSSNGIGRQYSTDSTQRASVVGGMAFVYIVWRCGDKLAMHLSNYNAKAEAMAYLHKCLRICVDKTLIGTQIERLQKVRGYYSSGFVADDVYYDYCESSLIIDTELPLSVPHVDCENSFDGFKLYRLMPTDTAKKNVLVGITGAGSPHISYPRSSHGRHYITSATSDIGQYLYVSHILKNIADTLLRQHTEYNTLYMQVQQAQAMFLEEYGAAITMRKVMQ